MQFCTRAEREQSCKPSSGWFTRVGPVFVKGVPRQRGVQSGRDPTGPRAQNCPSLGPEFTQAPQTPE